MNRFYLKQVGRNVLILCILVTFAYWFSRLPLQSGWQKSGLINFFLGFVMLSAFMGAGLLQYLRLPFISGYIFAGILVGPHVTGFLSTEMVEGMKLVDDLALSFIALTAGGALELCFIKSRMKAIVLNIVFQTVIVVICVFIFVEISGRHISLLRGLASSELLVLAILLSVVAVARSPSSAIAVINECSASGPFTDTVFGVTVVMDVIIIVLFALALTVSKIILSGTAVGYYQTALALSGEIVVSLAMGIMLGRIISAYINRSGRDLPLFLLFVAFGVSKLSAWITVFMSTRYDIYLNLEPLLICMSAGFTVRNLSTGGDRFMDSLEQVDLPIYVLFFSLSGASLDLKALWICWPFALGLAAARMLGISAGAWLAGLVNKDPMLHNRNAWMAYVTQAGVAIGLARLAQRQFPEIGMYLNTIVLAIIAVNQVLGPITFKRALNQVGETKDSRLG